MNFKKRLIATTIALALVIPTTVFASTSTSTTAIKIRGLFGIDSSKLTSTQLADVQDYAQKMADLQKNLLDKMVSNGSMTQEQADEQKALIESNLANGEVFVENGHKIKGKGGFKGNKIDTSKLTDDQKKALLDLEKEQLSLENDLAKILVEQSLITQAQADEMKTKVDAAISSLTTSNLTDKLLGSYVGRLNMLQGITLTDTQKTALSAWAEKSADIQKKIVSLYKDAGAITQDQADIMNSQIDAKAADPFTFNKMGDGKMVGRRGGYGKEFGSGAYKVK